MWPKSAAVSDCRMPSASSRTTASGATGTSSESRLSSTETSSTFVNPAVDATPARVKSMVLTAPASHMNRMSLIEAVPVTFAAAQVPECLESRRRLQTRGINVTRPHTPPEQTKWSSSSSPGTSASNRRVANLDESTIPSRSPANRIDLLPSRRSMHVCCAIWTTRATRTSWGRGGVSSATTLPWASRQVPGNCGTFAIA